MPFLSEFHIERRFKNTSASFPSKPSQDTTTKEVKCLLCSKQGSKYFFFVMFSANFTILAGLRVR